MKICSIERCGKTVRSRGYCRSHYTRWLVHGDPLGGSTGHGEHLRWITETALVYDGDDCLKWPFGTNGKGAGLAWVNGVRYMASRYICEQVHGEPPTPDHEAAHSCGKGHEGCVNPKHLRWATPKENQSDRLLHNTDVRGEKHKRAKLTGEQVQEIRALRRVLTYEEMAKRYGVSKSNISAILNRESWAWLG